MLPILLSKNIARVANAVHVTQSRTLNVKIRVFQFVVMLVELTNTVFVNSTPRVDSSMIILIFSTCDHQIKTLPSQYIVIGGVRYSQFLGCFLHLCNRFTYLFCTFGRPFDEFIIGG